VSDTGAMISVDGRRGMGQSVTYQAMELAIARARQHGVCVMGLRNSHHLGRVGHGAEQAVAAGLVSIHFTNAVSRNPMVSPFGGGQGRFNTNPFTVGIRSWRTDLLGHQRAHVGTVATTSRCSPGCLIDNGRPPTIRPSCFEPAGGPRRLRPFAGGCAVDGVRAAGRGAGGAKPLGVTNCGRDAAIVFVRRASADRKASRPILRRMGAHCAAVGRWPELGSILMPGTQAACAARAQIVPIDPGDGADGPGKRWPRIRVVGYCRHWNAAATGPLSGKRPATWAHPDADGARPGPSSGTQADRRRGRAPSRVEPLKRWRALPITPSKVSLDRAGTSPAPFGIRSDP
jgi:hypothetical protein